jgi:hypothetical protein
MLNIIYFPGDVKSGILTFFIPNRGRDDVREGELRSSIRSRPPFVIKTLRAARTPEFLSDLDLKRVTQIIVEKFQTCP